MRLVYNRRAPKRATNLSINSDLLQRARELNVNLSSALEQTLVRLVRRRLSERWVEQNRAAIAAYNDRVDKQGVFSDGVRSF